MAGAPQNRVEAAAQAKLVIEQAPDTIALNFYEPQTPVNKLLFTLQPGLWDCALRKITYSIGSLDLSVNGYIQLVVSRVMNPNLYAVQDANSDIIFSKMAGANIVENAESNFDIPVVVGKGENLYIWLVANLPPVAGAGVVGRMAILYNPLYK